MNQNDREHFLALSEMELLARCLWGEARGEPMEGVRAVVNVIQNRVRGKSWYGVTLKNVILKPWQFSCFNDNDPNFEKLKAGPIGEVFGRCLFIAELSVKGLITDNTDGSTHYHVVTMRFPPKWSTSDSMFYKKTIGNHKFYEEI